MTWLPYDEDEDNELVLPVKFRFESGCSDETDAAIFSCIIKLCLLPTEFHHGRGKMATGAFLLDNLPTYEFYNPSFVARQFGLGQLPPRLFFSKTLKPREGISEMMEASRVFQLGSDIPSLCLHEWTRATFSSNLLQMQFPHVQRSPTAYTLAGMRMASACMRCTTACVGTLACRGRVCRRNSCM